MATKSLKTQKRVILRPAKDVDNVGRGLRSPPFRGRTIS